MLVETGAATGARALLEPLVDDPVRAADAEALLGTLFYWRGDLRGAEAHLQRALLRNAGHAEAGRLLHEIRAATAPWLRFRSAYAHDDQPLQSAQGVLEGGFRLGSGPNVGLRVQPHRFWSATGEPTVVEAEGSLSQAFSRHSVKTEAAAGVLHLRTLSDWTGRLMVQGRLRDGLTLRLAVERAPYLATPSSLAGPIMTRSAGGSLDFASRSGWLGQAGYAHRSFPDDNAVESAYAWIVAPVLGGSPPRLGFGYAVNGQDSRASRFVPLGDDLLTSGAAVPGHYVPYYTPARVRSHQFVATTSVRPGGGLAVGVSGSWAFYAREEAPYLVPAPGDPAGFERLFFSRRFRPWSARASVSRALHDLTLAVRAEHLVTSQYASTSVELEVGYRFAGPAPRGGGR